jgi:hypothetical protein
LHFNDVVTVTTHFISGARGSSSRNHCCAFSSNAVGEGTWLGAFATRNMVGSISEHEGTRFHEQQLVT